MPKLVLRDGILVQVNDNELALVGEAESISVGAKQPASTAYKGLSPIDKLALLRLIDSEVQLDRIKLVLSFDDTNGRWHQTFYVGEESAADSLSTQDVLREYSQRSTYEQSIVNDLFEIAGETTLLNNLDVFYGEMRKRDHEGMEGYKNARLYVGSLRGSIRAVISTAQEHGLTSPKGIASLMQLASSGSLANWGSSIEDLPDDDSLHAFTSWVEGTLQPLMGDINIKLPKLNSREIAE